MSIVSSDIQVATDMVAYCEVGVRASLFALLHEVYTGTIVPVYDGSLMEWSLQHDLPMELPANLQPLNSRSGYGRGTTQEADEGLLLFGSGWMSA